jgi:hypothetical protein
MLAHHENTRNIIQRNNGFIAEGIQLFVLESGVLKASRSARFWKATGSIFVCGK